MDPDARPELADLPPGDLAHHADAAQAAAAGHHDPAMAGTDRPSVRLTGVIIECRDLPRLVTFWSVALGYRPVPGDHQRVVLEDPDGTGARVELVRRDDAGNAGHAAVEVEVRDPELYAERLSVLGGTLLDRRSDGGARWAVVADPEGNVLRAVAGN